MRKAKNIWKGRFSRKKRALGDAYERFIAENYYSFDDGWTVEFSGINNRLKDLGRDLVISKEDESIIVQCKYWSAGRRVRERHIFQLYGTLYVYKLEHPNKEVRAVFYTSAQFSEEAKEFAKLLNIELHESVKPAIDIVKAYRRF
jgi:HJR/Mrr/RecB family endonuclease